MKKADKYVNYIESLKQKYNAVCFDIDGTLTKEKSNELDERAIASIVSLVKKKIPVVFITGRGETGLKDFIDDIYDNLINKYNISEKELRRIYFLTNDGTRLFFTKDGSNSKFLNESIYLASDESLEQLNDFNNSVIELMNIRTLCDITYSVDSKMNKILNVRLVFKNNNESQVKPIIDEINNLIEKTNYDNLVTTRGVFKGKIVIQVGVAKKDEALTVIEKLIGVPRNSMIRIGDCGDEYGNDYSMLNCEQGYTVDKYSESPNTCFPIYDKSGNILKGIDATLYIIKNSKIIPTVCLENADKQIYSNEYAKIERNITRGRNRCLLYYNDIINNKFDLIYGINELFDESSGSIKIPMYEWQIISNQNPLKKLFNEKNGDVLMYSIRDNNNYLLRGSKTYYYFLANRLSGKDGDITSFENVYEWYDNNICFLKKALLVLDTDYDYNDVSSKKLFLGLLDNVRNITLVLLNHILVSKYNSSNLLINISDNADEMIHKLYNVLYLNDYIMSSICFELNDLFDINKIKILLNNIIELLEQEQKNFVLSSSNNVNYSKEYRVYREIDNFAENYIAIKLDNDKNKNEKEYGVCGTCYGGIELPVIYKIIKPTLNDIVLLKLNSNVSGYKNKQLVDLRKFNVEEYGGILKIGNISNNMVLLDDNILTGKTMQLAINALYDVGINVKNINIVRYPSLNRVDQMFMKNHGAVDYRLFFDYITGLGFPSPYSWKDSNSLDPYLDSLGTFDLNRKKIIECLVKNHDYKNETEVAEYVRKFNYERTK